MDKIKEFFGDFNLYARVMPVLVVLLPIIILSCIKGIITDKLMEATIYIVVSIIFLTLMSNFARNRGKEYEKKMYNELGGMPTTILMRFSDDRINEVSKSNYHKQLNKCVEGIKLPLIAEEETEETDIQYEAAINWLRSYANSNRDKEFRVYQELKEYNFWRNLYGIKSVGVILYILIGIRECFIIKEFSMINMIMTPYPQYIALLCMVISLVIIMITVNKNIVKSKAFDYAKTLIEVCERLQ